MLLIPGENGMYDDLHGEVAVFDFDEFANNLLEQGLEASPSELHGCLCGLLAGGATTEPEWGLDALCQVLDLILHGELADQTMQIYTITAAALEDEEFDFHPLLPDDEVDIAERTESLGVWCRGFLAGFAHASAGIDKSAVALHKDSAEILKDFANIAQAGVDEDETEDEAEGSYMELVEYLRFAVLNVYMDSRSRVEGDDFSPEQVH
jgi:yecA family protein